MASLSYDILVHALELLSDDYPSLYYSSLVNWFFNHAASRILYARIVYSPPHRHIVDLKDRGTLPEPSMLASACTARNAPLIAEVEISGFISARSPPSFILCDTLASAIEKFTNLSKITLCPTTFHETLFTKSLEILPSLTHLRELTVNSSCMGGEAVPLLVQITQLRKLTLHSPGRLILNALPEWLGRLSPTLIALNLKDNCGSITPGVLNSFVPHVRERLRELTLGLSYSLTDDDVFTFLAQIPHLQRLRLQYYLQLKPPKTVLRLARLRSFMVDYTVLSTRSVALALSKWVKHIIFGAPLEALRLVCDDSRGVIGAHVPVDNIVDHLVVKHHTTLRILDLGQAYVGVEAAKAVFARCARLEDLCLSVRREVLDTFEELSEGLPMLHTAAFNIRNSSMKRALVDDEEARRIITSGPSLRRLLVNGAMWEGSWVSAEGGEVEFVVFRLRGLNNLKSQ